MNQIKKAAMMRVKNRLLQQEIRWNARIEQRNKAIRGIIARWKNIPEGIPEAVPSTSSSYRSSREVWPRPEVKGVFNCPDNFKKWLHKKGFERLGNGMFSTVYAKKGSNRVIKVTHREDGWIDYCKWADTEGFAGKFAPKVFSYKKFTEAKYPFEVSVVERMKETFWKIGAKENILVDKYLADLVLQGNQKAFDLAETINPGLGVFCNKLREKWNRLDLHAGNIMVREDGTMCFTDPIVGVATNGFTRWKTS